MGICKFWPEMSYGIISCLFGWNTLWFELNTVLKCNLRLDDRVFTSEDSSHSDCLYGLDQGYFHRISLLLRLGVKFLVMTTVFNFGFTSSPHWAPSYTVGHRQRHTTAFDGLRRRFDGLWRRLWRLMTVPGVEGDLSSDFLLLSRLFTKI